MGISLRVSLLLFCLVTLGILLSGSVVLAQGTGSRIDQSVSQKDDLSARKAFYLMARDLLGQPHWSERIRHLLDDHVPQIAIPPLPAEELPLSAAEAQNYVDGFTQALIDVARGRYAVVARKELGAVVNDINEMGMRSDSINPLGALIERSRSDLVAVGHLSLQGDNIVLSYKLVESETGRIVSATQRRFKRKIYKLMMQSADALSLQGAAKKAAQELMRELWSVDKIMVQGLRYQSSGIHTSFGRYFMGALSDALRRQATSGPRNINDLEIAPFVVEEEKFRGLQWGKADQTGPSSKKRRYILKGTYWVFDKTVEIRLHLEDEDGKSRTWRGRVIKSEIPQQLALMPPVAPIEEVDNKTLGPIDFFLSSNKGDHPLFNIGEKMVLAVSTGEDAYLYCYYIQADGVLFRIFPNRFLPSPHINGHFLQHIPSVGMPFSFQFKPPSGVEAVKCFALDRDVGEELGLAASKAAFEALPFENERVLTRLFRNLKNTKLSEASLIVTVEEK